MDTIDRARLIRAGDRRALARAITLVESARPDHRAEALALLAALRGGPQALRIGLSGTPGVGKSTFIETFGLMLAGQGRKVAVLSGARNVPAAQYFMTTETALQFHRFERMFAGIQSCYFSRHYW